MEYPVYNIEGKEVEKISLDDRIWGVVPREEVLHRAVVQYLACQRQGTSSTKRRGEVSGSGRKPWRQKGTGRARAGSIRSPLWRGGGVVFGPKPRDWRWSMPKKEKRLALIFSLSDKARENNLIILDRLFVDEIKTKKMVEILKNLNSEGKKILLLTDLNDENKKEEMRKIILASRNIKNVYTLPYNLLNAYSVLNVEKILLTKECVLNIEKLLQRSVS